MIGTRNLSLRPSEGTPQGGPLSPLLANILLDDLDKELERREHRFVRYADNGNIFVRSKRAGERVINSVVRLVDAKATIQLAPKTLERFKEKIRRTTCRTRSVSKEVRIEELNHYLIGWIGYYHIASAKTHCSRLDEWIRRRLRMCLWKQWKTPKTRLKKLRALGLPDGQLNEWLVPGVGHGK